MPNTRILPEDCKDRTYAWLQGACEARSVETLTSTYTAFLRGLGLKNWFFGRVGMDAHAPASSFMMAAGDPDLAWGTHYEANAYLPHDPAAQAALARHGVYSWREAAEAQPMTRLQARIYQEAREFGHPDGLCVPIRMLDGSVWLVTASCECRNIDPALRMAMGIAAQSYVTHAIRLGLFQQYGPALPGGELSARQRTILVQLARGYTQAEIARSLGLSVKRVESLLAEARDRMEARTTASLLARAIVSGVIDREGLGEDLH